METYHKIFGLSNVFNENELKSALINKISNINKIISNDYEKEFYIDALKHLYKKLKKNVNNKQLVLFNTTDTNTKVTDANKQISFHNKTKPAYSSVQSSSFSSITKDGETTINEEEKMFKNGKIIKDHKQSYKIDRNGNRIKI